MIGTSRLINDYSTTWYIGQGVVTYQSVVASVIHIYPRRSGTGLDHTGKL